MPRRKPPPPDDPRADPLTTTSFEDRLAAFRRGDHLQTTAVPRNRHQDALADRKTLAPWQPKAYLPSTINLFEDIVGGRDSLIGLLKLLDTDRTLQRLVPVLTKHPTWSLYRCLSTAQVSPATLARRIQAARTEFSQAAAARQVADSLPAVAADVMARALPNYEDLCPWCRGTGKKLEQQKTGETLPNGLKEVRTVEVPCTDCNGHGTVLQQPEIDRQRMALELGGLLQPKGGGVIVDNRQQSLSINPGQALVGLQMQLNSLDPALPALPATASEES